MSLNDLILPLKEFNELERESDTLCSLLVSDIAYRILFLASPREQAQALFLIADPIKRFFVCYELIFLCSQYEGIEAAIQYANICDDLNDTYIQSPDLHLIGHTFLASVQIDSRYLQVIIPMIDCITDTLQRAQTRFIAASCCKDFPQLHVSFREFKDAFFEGQRISIEQFFEELERFTHNRDSTYLERIRSFKERLLKEFLLMAPG